MATRRATLAVIGVLTMLFSLLPANSALAVDDARVEGLVTMPGGGVPDAPVRVVLSPTSWENPVTTKAMFVDEAGFYAFDAPAGAYYLWFEYQGEANVLPWIRSNGTWPNGVFPAAELTLTSGVTRTLDRPLIAGAVISGSATGAGAVPLSAVTVSANAFLTFGRSSFDPATGLYTLDRVPPRNVPTGLRVTATLAARFDPERHSHRGAGPRRSGRPAHADDDDRGATQLPLGSRRRRSRRDLGAALEDQPGRLDPVQCGD